MLALWNYKNCSAAGEASRENGTEVCTEELQQCLKVSSGKKARPRCPCPQRATQQMRHFQRNTQANALQELVLTRSLTIPLGRAANCKGVRRGQHTTPTDEFLQALARTLRMFWAGLKKVSDIFCYSSFEACVCEKITTSS